MEKKQVKYVGVRSTQNQGAYRSYVLSAGKQVKTFAADSTQEALFLRELFLEENPAIEATRNLPNFAPTLNAVYEDWKQAYKAARLAKEVSTAAYLYCVPSRPGEQWRPIAGISDHYVSDHGRVKRFTSKWGYEEVPQSNIAAGYWSVGLPLPNGDHQRFYVHRLVAGAFLPPPSIKRNQVNHKDLDKKNNHYSNIEWVTAQENVAHAIEAGRHPASPLYTKSIH